MPEAHADLCGGEVCREVRSTDLRVLKRGSLQIHVSHVAATEIAASEIGVAEVDSAEVDLAKIGTTQISAAEVDGISAFNVLVEGLDLTDTQELERAVRKESWCSHGTQLRLGIRVCVNDGWSDSAHRDPDPARRKPGILDQG